ncbi:MAG: hypothetical protein ACFFAO_10410 [Candidatus Hermodarchaeota archaeon]
MGFKRINQEELETKTGPCFIGMPLRRATDKGLQMDMEIANIQEGYSMGASSNIFIKNEEVLEFQYDYDGERKSLIGSGNMSITNTSMRDRIWDAKLRFSGSEFINIEAGDDLNLGIFEPNSTKTINYEIIKTHEINDMLQMNEEIEILNNEIEIYQEEIENTGDIQPNLEYNGKNKKYLLLQGRENKVKFTITLENVSTYSLENIKFKKQFSKHFFGLQWESQNHTNINVKADYLDWTLTELKPGAGVRLIIYAKIIPNKKEVIRTGNIEISYNLKDSNFSGTEITDFSAYSHAMHAINKIEEEDTPNQWQCSLKFENHSDFVMKLKSIYVLDKSRINTFLDLNFQELIEKSVLQPGESYVSKVWNINDENEPKFSRKIEYSIDYQVDRKSTISAQIDDYHFEIVQVEVKKEISKDEIKSFEESQVDNKVLIKNVGTIPIDTILIKETIPKDFLPPMDKENFKLRNSKTVIKPENYDIIINPQDGDSSKEHTLEVKIDPGNNHLKHAVNVDDFIELEYSLKAVNPDNKVNYEFPVEIDSFYAINNNDLKEYFLIKSQLEQGDKPSIKISHRRRKITMEKEIFPGKNIDEFSINITVKNQSNVEIKNIDISDTFPTAFKLISSNLKNQLSKPDNEGFYTISFIVDKILPYQEKEINYYLQNVSGKEIQYSELESYLYG